MGGAGGMKIRKAVTERSTHYPLKERAAARLKRALRGCLKERDAEGSSQAGNLREGAVCVGAQDEAAAVWLKACRPEQRFFNTLQ